MSEIKGLESIESCITKIVDIVGANPTVVLSLYKDYFDLKCSYPLRNFIKFYKILGWFKLSKNIVHLKDDLTLKIAREICSSCYGEVHLVFVNKNRYIMKMPKAWSEIDKFKGEDMIHFLYESLLHILLSCLRDVLRVKNFHYPIPETYILGKILNDQNGFKLFLITEKLDTTLLNFLDENTDEMDFIDILSQIALFLYHLQNTISFIHGDFHDNNIMIKYRKEEIKQRYHIANEIDYTTISKVQVYFIDLSTTCANFEKCCDISGSFGICEKGEKREIWRTKDLKTLFYLFQLRETEYPLLFEEFKTEDIFYPLKLLKILNRYIK